MGRMWRFWKGGLPVCCLHWWVLATMRDWTGIGLFSLERVRGDLIRNILNDDRYSLLYTERAVGVWNGLAGVVEADTIAMFHRLLDRHEMQRMLEEMDHVSAEVISSTWHHVQHRHCGPKGLYCSIFYDILEVIGQKSSGRQMEF